MKLVALRHVNRAGCACGFVVAVSVMILLSGCRHPSTAFDWIHANPWRTDGQVWTIMCMELQGEHREENAERVADTLRRTPGIRADDVYVVHHRRWTKVYYGKYTRYPKDKTGRLTVPQKLRSDMALIKDLAGPEGGRFFYEARVVPEPTPDPGNPKWHLRNNPGVYTLRVAIFYNEGEMREREKYAVKYCEELRSRGYEAYYRHGEITSEVYVGSWGEEAMVRKRRSGIWAFFPSKEVQEFQKNENFMYELWNMKVFSSKKGERRVRRASRLVEVRKQLGYGEYELP